MENQEIGENGEIKKLDNMGVDMAALIAEFNLSTSYVEQYTRDFPDLDNIVDGVPVRNDPDNPFIGDTTLPGLVRSIPRQSLQQLPVLSVVVNGTKNSVAALVCTYLLKKTAFNEDTFGKGLLSTLQIGAEQALTHGYAPFLVATGSMYNDFGTTMRLLHYSDTSPEPGISDSNESGYHYVIANLTPSRVRKILDNARKNPETTWNIPALEAVLESTPRAKDYSIYESDPRKNSAGDHAGPTYQFVTRYETGPGATNVTFCPDVTEAPLRVMDSRSKFGYPRVQYLVIDPAALTPFGISRVRLASPNQNLMNIYLGNIAAMLLLNSKPPLFKRGRFLKPVQLKQGAVWESLDPNAQAELKNLDNGSLQFFPQMAQQFAGQIQNIMGGQTQTITAGKQDAFGKTTVGQKRASEFLDISSKQITNILENFLRQYALVALDTLLSEQTGVDYIIVDDETKNAINKLAETKWRKRVPIDPMTGMPVAEFVPPIGDDNKLRMEWERFYEAIEEWSVEISVSLTKDELKDEKRADLQDMLVTLLQNDDGSDPEFRAKAKQIMDLLLEDRAPLIGGLETTQPAMPQPGMAPQPQLPAGPEQLGGESLTQTV